MGKARIIKTALLFFYILISTNISSANPVLAPDTQPQGASVTQSSSTTTVNQTSPQAIITWQSFNIDKGQTTQFIQKPSDIALNRINPQQGVSQIYGSLTGNGKIILINQAGIYFGPGSYVNVGSLVASTTDITNQNFLAGKYMFDQRNPSYSGIIINQGTLIAAKHGLVALLATYVENDGTIRADLGNIVLASGNKMTLSFANDDLIYFTVNEATPANNSGVTNAGKIIANGGKVLITADAAEGVVNSAINMRGVVLAKSIEKNGGEIILQATNSKVNVSGKLIASGNHQGGTIKIAANNIHIASSAVINANGKTAGGKIALTTKPQIKNASNDPSITIDQASLITASARSGQGGQVLVQAQNNTDIAGKILVQGGLAGDGGTIKILGKDIHIASSTVLDASGNTGGGTILVGGNTRGTGAEPNATNTTVAKGAVINASAVKSGNGGKVVIWSNSKTDFAGTILAAAGSNYGNGGFVEVSGKKLIYHDAFINVKAANGQQNGNILFDPENLTIQTAGPTTASSSGSPINGYTSNTDNSILTVADLETALANANVTVQTGSVGNQAGNITVANNVTWNNSNTLELSAYQHINVNANISNSSGGTLILNADNTRTGNGLINFNGGTVNMSGGGGFYFYYSPATFPTQSTFANNVNVSNGTSFNTSTFYNNLTNGFSTGLAPITGFNWPQIQAKIASGSIPIGPAAAKITVVLNTNPGQGAISHTKEISKEVTCDEMHGVVCNSLTFE